MQYCCENWTALDQLEVVGGINEKRKDEGLMKATSGGLEFIKWGGPK